MSLEIVPQENKMADVDNSPTFKSRTELLIHNETTKHAASWCNTFASNVLVAGAIAPCTAALLNITLSGWLVSFSCLFVAGAVIIRGYGAEILKDLKDADDVFPADNV